MADKNDLIVEGYYFGSYDDAKKANKEIKNAQYLNDKMENITTSQRLALYNKMLDEKVFSTPVGWEYLKFLRNELIELGIDESEIRPIPLYITFNAGNDDNKYSHIAKMYVKPRKDLLEKTKNNFKISLIFNILLIFLIIVMFLITMNSTSPNIINYKTVIVDQYSSWEQELKEKEQELKLKEQELNKMESLDENISG